MKRDLDLIREMMLASAEATGPVKASAFEGRRSHELVGYNVKLLGQSGLAEVTVRAADGDPYYYAAVDCLTWDGCEFLDNIREQSAWEAVKRKVAEYGGSMAVELVKAVAMDVAKGMMAGHPAP